MSKAVFYDSWYVQKNRIQLFVPLQQDYSFEIDKTGNGKLNLSGTAAESAARFSSMYDADGDIPGSADPKPMIFNGAEISGLRFKDGDADVVNFNASINSLMTSAMYGSGRSTTINYWTFPTSTTNNQSLPPAVGITNNTILAESYPKGYAFYVGAHTSRIDLTNNDLPNNIRSHRMNLYGMYKTDESLSCRLVDEDSPARVTPVTIPSNVWIMNTIVLDHTNTMNMKCTIHVRFYDTDGNYNHYWSTYEHMNIDDYPEIVNRQTTANVQWMLGASLYEPQNDVATRSGFYNGALRNLMVYNMAIGSDEMDTIFRNRIDPYEAVTVDETDIDSFDPNFWGKYGVLASNSNVKIEKSIVGKVSRINQIANDEPFPVYVSGGQDGLHDNRTNPVAHQRRFDIAGRDKAKLEIISPDIYEGNNIIASINDSKSTVFDVANLQKVDSLSAAVWRNSFITGNGKIRMMESKTLTGSFIEGSSSVTRVAHSTNPEKLPSGRYITYWTKNAVDAEASATDWSLNKTGGINVNYPNFLPTYYLRDRIGKTYKDYQSSDSLSADGGLTGVDPIPDDSNPTINGMFWHNTSRFLSIPWIKPGQLDNKTDVESLAMDEIDRSDFCSNWDSVYWAGAIYEINNEPTLADTGFFGTIRLTLFTEDFSKSAVYFKLRKPTDNTFSDWQFDSLNEFNSTKEKERLARIYLPHINIPVVKIPFFEPKLDVETWNSEEHAGANQFAAMQGSNLIMFSAAGSTPTSYGQIGINGSVNSNTGYDNVYIGGGDGSSYYFKPNDSGWYEITSVMSKNCGDRNYDVIMYAERSQGGGTAVAADRMGSFVAKGQYGGGHDATTLKIVMYVLKSELIRIYFNYPTWVKWVTVNRGSIGYGHINGGKILTDAKIREFNIDDADRHNRYVTSEVIAERTRKWINVKNVEAKYTKTIRQDNEPYEYETPPGNY